MQEGVSEQVRRLATAAEVSPDQKAIVLGVYLIRQVGADVLDLPPGSEIRKQQSTSTA
jgi:hypothetical protein